LKCAEIRRKEKERKKEKKRKEENEIKFTQSDGSCVASFAKSSFYSRSSSSLATIAIPAIFNFRFARFARSARNRFANAQDSLEVILINTGISTLTASQSPERYMRQEIFNNHSPEKIPFRNHAREGERERERNIVHTL